MICKTRASFVRSISNQNQSFNSCGKSDLSQYESTSNGLSIKNIHRQITINTITFLQKFSQKCSNRISNNPNFFFLFPDAQFKCPNDKYGQYRDEVQCDKYYECVDGRATEKLCADGLVFDETIRLKNKCDQPFNVDCEDRIELRECYIFDQIDTNYANRLN